MKKLLAIFLVFFGVIVLAACGESLFGNDASGVQPGSSNWDEDTKRMIATAAEIQNNNPADITVGKSCPMCGLENVTWRQATTDLGKSTAAGVHEHIYVDGAMSHDAEYLANISGKNSSVCIVFKNADISTTGCIYENGQDNVINIMGNGVITSSGARGDKGLFDLDGVNTTLNLYGGTYIYTGGETRGANAASYAAINTNSGNFQTVNLFNETTVGMEIADTGANTVSFNIWVSNAVFNMYGGVIRNGVSNTYYSGNVNIDGENAAFNMYDGKIQGGTYTENTHAVTGANVRIASGVFNMYGGVVSGGRTVTEGSAAVSGGGNLYITGDGSVHLFGGRIADGFAKQAGGNVFVYKGSLELSGTALVSGGTTVNGLGDDIMLGIQKDQTKKLVIRGGFCSGKVEAGSQSVEVGGTAELRNLIIKENAKLTVNADFAGSIRVKFPPQAVSDTIAEGNGVCTGSFSGNVIMEDGTALIGENTALVVISKLTD